MKRRLLALVLSLTMCFSAVTVVQASTLDDLKAKINDISDITKSMLDDLKDEMVRAFRDTKKSGWYADHVAKILGLNCINGYPDGTFQPNGTITRAEFTKILIAALYGEQSNTDCNSHWSCAYVKKAEGVGILSKDEFNLDTIDKPITRQEMARMISLAADKKLGEDMATNLSDIERIVTDSKDIGSGYKDHVLSAYSKGIIQGYPDKSFGPKKTATRAEASTMLVNLLDSELRSPVGTVKWDTVVENGYVLPAKEDKVFWTWEVPEAGDAPTIAKLSIVIDLYGDYSVVDQWAAAETALLSKHYAATVKRIMDHVKKRVTADDILPDLEFAVGNNLFWVTGSGGVSSIQVFNQ